MLKKSISLIAVLLTFSLYGQSAGHMASSTAIKANFSIESITAYQESASLKIEDYYKYLELLSDSSTSEVLKTEARKALFSLFRNRNSQVPDFTTQERSLISLPELTEKIKGKDYRFVLSERNNILLTDDSWTSSYLLEIHQGNLHQSIKYLQKVYFTPVIKKFGSIEKEIWVLQLGEIE